MSDFYGHWDEYVPNSIVVERAVELWKNWINYPTYVNKGVLEGDVPNSLASTLASRLAEKYKDDDLEKFSDVLRKILTEKTEFVQGERKRYGYTTYLSVDYDPCVELQYVKELSGIKRNLPWKTEMQIGRNYLSYCKEYQKFYNYPLKDGRWFETNLKGDDIEKVIDLIDEGVLDLNLKKI